MTAWRPRLRWDTKLPGLLPRAPVSWGEQQPYALIAPFLRVALLAGLAAGFGLGAALALALATRHPLGAWWPAAVAIHARIQLLDFLGLFILATGLHFLPRLRGAPLASPAVARAGLLAYATGTLASAFVLALAAVAAPARLPCQVAAALGDVAGWAGATAIIVVLARTLRSGPPLGQRGGLVSVLPYLAFGMGALWLALLLRAVADALATRAGSRDAPAAWDPTIDDLLLYGFATAVALAVSARLLPIYLGVEVVGPLPLRAVFACLAAGVVAQAAGNAIDGSGLIAAGSAFLGVALVAFPLVSGVPVGGRRDVRAADPPAFAALYRAPNAIIRSAFAWLALCGAALLLDGAAGLARGTRWMGDDAARHAAGLGYLTILIFGVGSRMLPGFARLKPRPSRLPWLVLALGNGATACRVVPAIVPRSGMWSSLLDAMLGLSGVLGFAAVGLFAASMWPALHDTTPRDGNRAAARSVRER